MLQYKESAHRFYVLSGESGEEIAKMTFTRISENKATIDHTFVQPSYQGQGIADSLLKRVVDKLKQEGREIIPICSFAIKRLSPPK